MSNSTSVTTQRKRVNAKNGVKRDFFKLGEESRSQIGGR